MGRIQRYAEGFLALVGNKVGGREPTELSDVVIPTIDLSPFLKARTLAVEGGISLTSTIGDQITVEVPDGEIWLVRTIAAETVLSQASADIKLSAAITNLPGSSDPINYCWVIDGFQSTIANIQATAKNVYLANFGEPIVLTPGAQVRFEVIDTNDPNETWSGKVLFYKLRA